MAAKESEHLEVLQQLVGGVIMQLQAGERHDALHAPLRHLLHLDGGDRDRYAETDEPPCISIDAVSSLLSGGSCSSGRATLRDGSKSGP